ncbi:hypothetical protein VTN49DRAFT_7199 [Thermomyces lanuginosus]|uniref:uncharacterized protein n=1 Tax=Thermomyces lanuginosus TaxID=5541 RepID=UPI0037443EE8
MTRLASTLRSRSFKKVLQDSCLSLGSRGIHVEVVFHLLLYSLVIRWILIFYPLVFVISFSWTRWRCFLLVYMFGDVIRL